MSGGAAAVAEGGGGTLEMDEDPSKYLEEFHNLYSQRIRVIEEKCPNPAEAKVQVLEMWVADLREQNRALVRAVNELEAAALDGVRRAEQLASGAKDSLSQDVQRRILLLDRKATGTQGNWKERPECKVNELEKKLKENAALLEKYEKELSRLQKQNKEKNDKSTSPLKLPQTENDRMLEMEKKLAELENDLEAKKELIQNLQEQQHQFETFDIAPDELDCMKDEIERLTAELENKDCLLNQMENRLRGEGADLKLETIKCTIESDLRATDKELRELKKCHEKNLNLLIHQRQVVNQLTDENDQLRSKMEGMEGENKCLANREEKLKAELCKLKHEAEQSKKRVQDMEKLVKDLQSKFDELEACTEDKLGSQKTTEDKMKCLIGIIKKKESEIQSIQEKFSEMAQCCQKRDEEMNGTFRQLQMQLRLKNEEILSLMSSRNRSQEANSPGPEGEGDHKQVELLRSSLLELKTSLTSEISGKEEEIHLLKREINSLEEKLERSEKQTHYREMLIAQLRKEVKQGQEKLCESENYLTSLKRDLFEMSKELSEAKIENSNLREHLIEMEAVSKLQIQEVEKLQRESDILNQQLADLKTSEAENIANCRRLSEEVEALKEEKQKVELGVFTMQDELVKIQGEVGRRQCFYEREIQNLRKYVKENESLIQRQSQLSSYIRDLETLLNEKQTSDAGGDIGQGAHCMHEETIAVLTARINKMSEYIAERDEIIKLIEVQLQMSTKYMMEDSEKEDYDQGRRLQSYYESRRNVNSQQNAIK